MSAPYVIAEIGGNHAGDLDLARRMMGVAAQFCQVDSVKFQKRDNRVLLSQEQYDAPHPNAMHSFGDTYGAHREFLEFDLEQHRLLKKEAARLGVTYSTSVWDLPSAKDMASLQPDYLKIPSATNLNFELLTYLCQEFGGDIHLSLGMTTRAEEQEIVELIERHGRLDSLVLYSCVSGYPVSFEDLSLLDIDRLVGTYGSRVKGIGFSGHHLGIAADVAAMALGAQYIERHFTLDRTSKGTDHSASLEPDGLRKLVRDVRNVSLALTQKREEILEVEKVQRAKLKNVP